jgi:hypothetical protein
MADRRGHITAEPHLEAMRQAYSKGRVSPAELVRATEEALNRDHSSSPDDSVIQLENTGEDLYAIYVSVFRHRHPLPWAAMHEHERELWRDVAQAHTLHAIANLAAETETGLEQSEEPAPSVASLDADIAGEQEADRRAREGER